MVVDRLLKTLVIGSCTPWCLQRSASTVLGRAVADALRDAIRTELLIHLRGGRTVASAWPIGRHAATRDFSVSNRVE